MCSGPEQSKSVETPSPATKEVPPNPKDMNHLTGDTEYSFSSLLDLAASNDVAGFEKALELNAGSVSEVGFWYGRQAGSKKYLLEHRTPLMVAATYGSVDVLKLILSHSIVNVNHCCGPDKTTALHCAASGGSVNATDVVQLLLAAGADPSCKDANGHTPVDVTVVLPKLQCLRLSLQELLNGASSSDGGFVKQSLRVSVYSSKSNSSTLSTSLEHDSPPSPLDLVSAPISSKLCNQPHPSAPEKKEYPIDPSFPDIKNSIYATDEFRMFSFKVRPCSRAYSHDWTECPFVHPGENARRRDPRKFHYSCVPCPEFRKGTCKRVDMCEYAHGVFECWLHPAQYRTRLCKDGTSCDRRVCFFAHTPEELRPLYLSTGSALPSPHSSTSAVSVMDMAATMSLLPSSPSAASSISSSPFTRAMSPSGNGIAHSSVPWPQSNVPTLHIPGNNHQSSRLRSSFSAQGIPAEDFSMSHLGDDLTCFSRLPFNSGSLNHLGRSKTLTPSNLEELFSVEISSSPRYSDAVFSPTCKSSVLNQFQQHQSMLSPINTNLFSPKNVEHPLLQASFGVSSPGRMSPRSMEPISPLGSSRIAAFARREKQQRQFRSLSARELGSSNPASVVGSAVSSWSKWGSPNGKLDWSVNRDELDRLQKRSPFELGNNKEEPDLSWVQSLVKGSPPEMVKENVAVISAPLSGVVSSGEAGNSNSQIESIDHSVIGAWIDQMQPDELVV